MWGKHYHRAPAKSFIIYKRWICSWQEHSQMTWAQLPLYVKRLATACNSISGESDTFRPWKVPIQTWHTVSQTQTHLTKDKYLLPNNTIKFIQVLCVEENKALYVLLRHLNYIISMHLKYMYPKDGRDSSAVMNTLCSCRSKKFSSQNPYGAHNHL